MSEYRNNIQEEILQIAEKYNRCSFDVSIRLGKTKSMLEIASKYNKVLVSYPNEPIYASWIADSQKFNINVSNITFTTNISLNKHNLQEYQCVICDEFDTLSVSNLEYIKDNLPDNLYLFSGTPPLKGSDKRAIVDVIAPIVYTVKLEDTIGHTSKDYSITVHLIDGSKTILTLKSGKTWTEQAKINWLENKYYKSNNWNDMLVLINAIKSSQSKFNYLKKFTSSNDRELIFVETKKQCDDLKLPSYYSDNKDSENNLVLFQNNKINKLVTINQLKASITFNNLNKAIILHTYSNYAKAHQKLGRCLTYSDSNIADLHILCIKNTIDEKWCRKSLTEFNQNKIQWVNTQ